MTTPPPRRGDDLSTAERILQAAEAEVATRGPKRLTLTAVADAAQVSRPTLYRWFPSKELLLAALTARGVHRFDEGLHRIIEANPLPDARLEAALSYVVRYLDDTGARIGIQAEPAFALQSLGDALASHVQSLTRLLGSALDGIPSVAAGEVTRAEASEVILRIAYSHYLFPHVDSDALVSALRGFVGLSARGVSRAGTPRPR